MSNVTQLIGVLAGHIGRDRGITARHLAGRLDVPERDVRKLITAAREEGCAVCGHPRDGYYIAATPEELLETVEFLKQRALCSLTLASRLSKIPLADLFGQLHLPT
jgi:biotin operon repressor